MGRLLDLDRDFIRAIARICFTDLVGECSRLGSEVVVGSAVIGCSRDDNTISQYVHLAAISWAPLQFHPVVGSLGPHTRLERNRKPTAASFLIEEGILLGLPADRHPPVYPWMEVRVAHLVAIVVVAPVFRYDARVLLAREGRDYITKLHVGEPGGAVVGGFARPHSVARNARVRVLAVGGFALVIPYRKEAAIRGGREVGLPLSAVSGVGVQFQWRAKGVAIVRGTDVEDIARIAGPAGVIDVVHHAV